MSQIRPRRTPASPERVRVRLAGDTCACDERGGVCGFHYAQMDDYRQARVRERAGIKFSHGNGR